MGWEEDARRLAASIARITSVTPSETWLNDRLVEFEFVPPNPEAARISLVVSEVEVIFGAGRGTRLELDGPTDSALEVEALAGAVASGHLSETVTEHHVSFALRPSGSPVLEGTSSHVGARVGPPCGDIEYGRYFPEA